MFNIAERTLNKTDSPKYFLYGGTKRLNTCKNSFIGCKDSIFKENRQIFGGFLCLISGKRMIIPLKASYLISSPKRVAEVEPVMRTFTNSPIWWLPLSMTTALFCSVRPIICSRLRLLKFSMRMVNSLPSSFLFCSALTSVCNLMSSLRQVLGCVCARTL